MRVTYQDCGCIALPEAIVSALGLTAGDAIEVRYDPELRAAMVTVISPDSETPAEGASCRIRLLNA